LRNSIRRANQAKNADRNTLAALVISVGYVLQTCNVVYEPIVAKKDEIKHICRVVMRGFCESRYQMFWGDLYGLNDVL